MKLLVVLALAFLAATASAFLAPSAFTGMQISQSTSTSESRLSMACRNNAKKQKAKRNQDNMRKFRKRGTSKKKIVRGKRQQTAREKEADFMAKLYQLTEGKEEA